VIPTQGKPGDVGFDLTAVEVKQDEKTLVHDGHNGILAVSKPCSYIEVRFGIAIEIPKGFFGIIVPRSSITKMNLMLKNSVGIIDCGYRGPLVARFQKIHEDAGPINIGGIYKVGERAAQLIILPCPSIDFIEVDELSESERGIGGFGSTGL
jgi:dUTP pyrophosphatase